MSASQIFRGHIVTAEEVVDGELHVEDGFITRIDGVPARDHDTAADVDFWIPGCVDLHSDNLEQHLNPRPGVSWPLELAVEAHDRDCAAAGITTVFDGIRIGELVVTQRQQQPPEHLIEIVDQIDNSGRLRVDHRLNLRCELLADGVVEVISRMIDHSRVGMISIMDHGPDAGPISRRRAFEGKRRKDGWSRNAIQKAIDDLELIRSIRGESVRLKLIELVSSRDYLRLASHDDDTANDILRNWQDGVVIAEFPLSMAAATAAAQTGLSVVMGAPNLVRGGSHTGNVPVADLLDAGLKPALASDYVPASLIAGAFLAHGQHKTSLPDAVALVSRIPAAIAGLDDVGELSPGRLANLVNVRSGPGGVRIISTFRKGKRIA